jgi:hypothetical protein
MRSLQKHCHAIAHSDNIRVPRTRPGTTEVPPVYAVQRVIVELHCGVRACTVRAPSRHACRVGGHTYLVCTSVATVGDRYRAVG